MKISFNNVFGYYLEVTNLHKSKVPETWIRKQTLANAERYITPELKEEGEVRDLIRLVQDLRKKQGLDPADRVLLTVPKEKSALIEKYRAEFTKTVGAKEVEQGDDFAVEKV